MQTGKRLRFMIDNQILVKSKSVILGMLIQILIRFRLNVLTFKQEKI